MRCSVAFVLGCLALVVTQADARPYSLGISKRVSDQRLAELETLLEMMSVASNRKMHVGFGLVDPYAIGRRKRQPASSSSKNQDYQPQDSQDYQQQDPSQSSEKSRRGEGPWQEPVLSYHQPSYLI